MRLAGEAHPCVAMRQCAACLQGWRCLAQSSWRGGEPMAKDWKVVIDDTGGEFSGWPSVCSETQDVTALRRAGFIQEHWDGPSKRAAIQIAHVVADFLNSHDLSL